MYIKNLQPVQLSNSMQVANEGNYRMKEKSPPLYCINNVCIKHCSSNKSSYLPNFHVIEIDVQLIKSLGFIASFIVLSLSTELRM